MKIVSWNVNGIRACYKKNLVSFVEAEKPDILCLQETKAHIDQVEESARKLNYNYSYWSSAKRKGYSGVATFLNKEPLAVQTTIGHEEYEQEGRIVITQHPQFDLYNIYFPNGGSGEVRHGFKQIFLENLKIHLKNQISLGKEIILVGDYNIAHTEIDIFDPKKYAKESGFLPEERAWFDLFLELGFIDTFRFKNPTAKERYSWWSYREFARADNRGWRIDHICITKGLISNLKSADILDQIEGSDHCPVVATFEF